MAQTDPPPSPFALTFGAALENETLYVTGVALELEERDVLHTIIWERYAGTWKRYQWKNRSDGVAAYHGAGGGTAVYLGFEGTLKVRSELRGSSEEHVEAKSDGPSTLRPLSAIRVVADHLYVAGMRRMVYRRALDDTTWSRFDAGLRLDRADLEIAGLNSIDGHRPGVLYACGMNGEIWKFESGRWAKIDSPSNLDLFAVCCVDEHRVVVAGALGTLLVGQAASWTAIDHSFEDETFTCVERWGDRCFVCSDGGSLYELTLGAVPTLLPMGLADVPRVNWIAATRSRVYFIGQASIVSLGDNGLRDESPPASLMV